MAPVGGKNGDSVDPALTLIMGTKDDADHIHMIVDNNPGVPSRIAALIEGHGENPGPCIAEMAKRLEVAGADVLVIPCNTAHYYHSNAADAVSIMNRRRDRERDMPGLPVVWR